MTRVMSSASEPWRIRDWGNSLRLRVPFLNALSSFEIGQYRSQCRLGGIAKAPPTGANGGHCPKGGPGECVPISPGSGWPCLASEHTVPGTGPTASDRPL